MAELNLDEIAARAQAAAQLAEAATAGPWEAKWDWVACKLQDRDIPVLSGERSTADVRFAAASRTDVPALAADVAALVAALAERDAEVARLRAELAWRKEVLHE